MHPVAFIAHKLIFFFFLNIEQTSLHFAHLHIACYKMILASYSANLRLN